jgi:hypothetical protein
VGNDDKLWVQQNLNALAATRAALAIQQTGRALPCSVLAVNPPDPATGNPLGYGFVHVQFELTVPYTKPDGTAGTYTLPPLILAKAESQWLRAPTQVGDFGMTVPADTFLGGISGLGTGVADLGTDYGNLSTLVFVPVAATSFPAAPDPNSAWVNGPNGAVLSDTAQTASVTVAENLVTIVAGSNTWTFDATGLTLSTGIVAETHVHDVTAVGSNTGEPIA